MPCTTLAHRAALSLVEIIMATIILAMVSLAVIQGMASTAEFAVMTEKQDDLALEAQRIFDEIGHDLSLSGWEFPSFEPSDYATADAVVDRQLLYYPYILQQSPTYDATGGGFLSPSLDAGLPADSLAHTDPTLSGSDFLHARRDGGLVALWQTGSSPGWVPSRAYPQLSGDPVDARRVFRTDTSLGSAADRLAAYADSFYARSQELLFLRASVDPEGWQPDPNEQNRPVLYFDGDSADWNPPGPEEQQQLIDTIYYPQKLATGLGASEALAEAHLAMLADQFTHEQIGVLRMTESALNGVDGDGDGRLEFNGEIRPRFRPTAPAEVQYIDNILAPGAWLALDLNNEPTVRTRWETCVDEAHVQVTSDAVGIDQRIRLDQLREYLYAVVPSPLGGAGRLLRAYSVDLTDGNGDGSPDTIYDGIATGVKVGQLLSSNPAGTRGFIVDKILSDHVARIVFDTYRSTPAGELALNEVRVRLYLAADHAGDDNREAVKMIRLQAEGVFTMRTGNNRRGNERTIAVLGDHHVPFPY